MNCSPSSPKFISIALDAARVSENHITANSNKTPTRGGDKYSYSPPSSLKSNKTTTIYRQKRINSKQDNLLPPQANSVKPLATKLQFESANNVSDTNNNKKQQQQQLINSDSLSIISSEDSLPSYSHFSLCSSSAKDSCLSSSQLSQTTNADTLPTLDNSINSNRHFYTCDNCDIGSGECSIGIYSLSTEQQGKQPQQQIYTSKNSEKFDSLISGGSLISDNNMDSSLEEKVTQAQQNLSANSSAFNQTAKMQQQQQQTTGNNRSNLFAGALAAPSNNNQPQTIKTKSKLILPTAFWALLLILGFCIILLLSSLNHTLKSLDSLIRLEKSNAQDNRELSRMETLASWLALPAGLSLDNAVSAPYKRHSSSSSSGDLGISAIDKLIESASSPNADTASMIDGHRPSSSFLHSVSDNAPNNKLIAIDIMGLNEPINDIRHEESILQPERRRPTQSFADSGEKNNQSPPFMAYIDHMNVNINTPKEHDDVDNSDANSENNNDNDNDDQSNGQKSKGTTSNNQDADLFTSVYDDLIKDIISGPGNSFDRNGPSKQNGDFFFANSRPLHSSKYQQDEQREPSLDLFPYSSSAHHRHHPHRYPISADSDSSLDSLISSLGQSLSEAESPEAPSFRLDEEKLGRAPVAQIVMIGGGPMPSPFSSSSSSLSSSSSRYPSGPNGPFSISMMDTDPSDPFMSPPFFGRPSASIGRPSQSPASHNHGHHWITGQQDQPSILSMQPFGDEQHVSAAKHTRPAPYEAGSFDQLFNGPTLDKSNTTPLSTLFSLLTDTIPQSTPATLFTTIVDDLDSALKSSSPNRSSFNDDKTIKSLDSQQNDDHHHITGGVMMFKASPDSEKDSISDKMQSLTFRPKPVDDDFLQGSTLSSLVKLITNTEPTLIFPNEEQKSKLGASNHHGEDNINNKKLDQDKVEIIDPSGSLVSGSLTDLLSSDIIEPDSISLIGPTNSVNNEERDIPVASIFGVSSDDIKGSTLDSLIETLFTDNPIASLTQLTDNRTPDSSPLLKEIKESINVSNDNKQPAFSTSSIFTGDEDPIKIVTNQNNPELDSKRFPTINEMVTAAQSSGLSPPANVPPKGKTRLAILLAIGYSYLRWLIDEF